MQKIEMKQEQQTRTFKWKEGDIPTVYANQIGVGMTPFDIAIVFGEVLETDETTVTGIPRVKILVTPEQAWNLKQILEVTLAHFANANGPLRTSGSVDPVELSDRLKKQTKSVN